MGTTRNIFKWVFENIAPGETDPEKRVDADRVMDNYRDLRDAVAVVEARGANAADGNRNGQSTPTQCNLTLKTANGQTGLLALGDYVQVWDGASKWYLTNTLADDELSFSDAELAEGEGPADYSAPAFIAALIIDVAKFRAKAGKDDLILAGDHPDKLTGDHIQVGGGDVSALGPTVAALGERVDVSLDEGGNIKPEAVANETMAKAAFLEEGFQNIIWGQFDADFDNDGLANEWFKFNTPTCEMDAAVRKVGARSQKVVASQPADGIYALPFAPHAPADYLGDYVAFAAWVRAGEDDAVVLEVYDGVRTTTRAAGGTAGAWERLGVEHQVDGAATTLAFRVYANRATTFHVDGAMAKRGRFHAGYAANDVEVMRTFMAAEDFANWAWNGDLDAWSNGADALPDFWQTGGEVNAPTAVARETTTYMFGVAALRLTLGLGEGAFYDVPNWRDFLGADVYAAAYFRGVAGANEIRWKIDDGVTSAYVDFVPDAAEWQRPGRAFRVSPTATRLRLTIANNDGGSVEFIVDGVTLTRGQFPLAFAPAALPNLLRWDFARAGAVTSGLMSHEGAALDVFAVPCDCVVHKIFAYEGTAPSAGADIFAVTNDGAPTALAASVAAGQHAASAHVPVSFAAGERLQVTATPGSGPGADAGVVVEGYRLGY